jgi:hypothetical protein
MAGAPEQQLHAAPERDVVVDDDDVERGFLLERHLT